VVGWRRLCNEELHKLHASRNVIWVVKSWRDKMDGICSTYGIDEKCMKKLKGSDHSKDLGVVKRVLFK
jgi:hypothetical protein